ncbi:unnamed protein product [Lactuca saligna]|uniref:C3H1-type domain-containing protein n=1 Tax=Lactuca saligna TaxID=75948 RepID=A0AA36EBT8_LACSI|nr:unnamed protein product [Lactuca saligna]
MDGSNIQLPYSSQPPPLINGGSTWSLPRATYVSDLFTNCSSSFSRNWAHTRLEHLHGKGSLNSVSSGSIYGGPGSIEQPYSSGSTNLPKRPREPECRYFMHTGNCKYGSDCKYHHPKEKIAQLAASSLGPLGLPLRLGQAVCSYYNLYGICKFEPTYKYDHPLMGYSYNYSMSLPNDNANAPSLFSYGGVNSSTLHSSGSSPSKSSKNEGAKTPGGGSPSLSPQRAVSPSHSE